MWPGVWTVRELAVLLAKDIARRVIVRAADLSLRVALWL